MIKQNEHGYWIVEGHPRKFVRKEHAEYIDKKLSRSAPLVEDVAEKSKKRWWKR